MNHLISDMEGEFEGELGEFMEDPGTRPYFTASETPWLNGPVERNGGIWKAAARKAIKDVGARGFVEMRRLASMVHWARNARINSSGCSPAHMGHRSRIQVALVTSGREARRRIGIAGVARKDGDKQFYLTHVCPRHVRGRETKRATQWEAKASMPPWGAHTEWKTQ